MRSQPCYRPGDKIGGRYQVHQALMGGMGEVYLCLDLEQDYPFVLKTFQARYLADLKARELFEQEVVTWLALEKHPNVVRCYGVEVLDSQPFMILEWIVGDEIRGVSLRSWLHHGPLELRLVLSFAIDICRGLAYAEQKQPGLVHRDLKPENILIGLGQLAKITDFGLASVVQKADLEILDVVGESGERQRLMKRGDIVGTPPYMAPEQWRGEPVDIRTDIYAVGCILYELSTGNRPFQATTLNGFRRQHLEARIPTLRKSDTFPRALDTVLSHCLSQTQRRALCDSRGPVSETGTDLSKPI